MTEPNYSMYTHDELLHARSSLDAEQWPARLVTINKEIEKRAMTQSQDTDELMTSRDGVKGLEPLIYGMIYGSLGVLILPAKVITSYLDNTNIDHLAVRVMFSALFCYAAFKKLSQFLKNRSNKVN